MSESACGGEENERGSPGHPDLGQVGSHGQERGSRTPLCQVHLVIFLGQEEGHSHVNVHFCLHIVVLSQVCF